MCVYVYIHISGARAASGPWSGPVSCAIEYQGLVDACVCRSCVARACGNVTMVMAMVMVNAEGGGSGNGDGNSNGHDNSLGNGMV